MKKYGENDSQPRTLRGATCLPCHDAKVRRKTGGTRMGWREGSTTYKQVTIPFPPYSPTTQVKCCCNIPWYVPLFFLPSFHRL